MSVGFGQFRLTKTRTARIWPIWPYACFSPVCTYRVPHPCAPPTGISFCPVQPSRVLKTPGQTTHKCSHQFHPILHYMLLDWCCSCPQCSPWIITHGSHSSPQEATAIQERLPLSFHSGSPLKNICAPPQMQPTSILKYGIQTKTPRFSSSYSKSSATRVTHSNLQLLNMIF